MRPGPCEIPLEPAAAAPCAHRARPYVLAVAILGSSLGFIDGTVVTIALPAMRADLDASLATLQWIVTGYMLFLSAFVLVGGAAGDAFGQRRVFNGGLLSFAVASALCGLAPGGTVLVAARMVQGLAAAFMVPASLALISINFPKAERGRAIGIWAAASGITAAVGPIIGGLIVDLAGWRPVFLLNIPLAVAAIALSLRHVPQREGRAGVRMDWLGAGLACSGLGGVTWALTRAGEHPDATMWAAGACGLALLAAFVRHQRHSAAPMMPLGLFADRVFAGGNGLTLSLYFALSGVLFFLPVTLVEAQGYTAALAGSVLLPFTVVMAALSGWAGSLATRAGARLPLSLGPFLVGLAFLALIPAVRDGGFATALVPAMLFLGVGMGLTVAPISTVVMGAVGEDLAGIASGINNAVARLAGLLAVAALGPVASAAFSLSAGRRAAAMAPGVSDGDLAALDYAGAEVAPGLAPLHSTAMIDAFAVVAAVTAGCAFVAAVTGWLTMPGRPPAASPEPAQ